MSIHKSLRTKGKLVRSRSVLSRYERIQQLEKSGRWKEGENSPFGLAKVRVLKAKKRGKEKKQKEEAPVAAPAPGAAPAAAAPAAGKPAAKPAAKPAGKPAGKPAPKPAAK